MRTTLPKFVFGTTDQRLKNTPHRVRLKLRKKEKSTNLLMTVHSNRLSGDTERAQGNLGMQKRPKRSTPVT
ncbi:MAG: hypothetical protein NVV73_15700 [Cellvibrionaceae bacterium]|nr:hypothetical protein [Cellvibrionaceae bacterium]